MTQGNWQILTSILCGLVAATAWGPFTDLVDQISLRYTSDLRRRASELGLNMSAFARWMRMWWLTVVVTFAFIWGVLRMPPVAALICLMMIGAPRTLVVILTERRRLRLRDQMVAAARSLSSQLRAGLDIPTGLKSVAAEARQPLKQELETLVTDYFHRGVPLTDGLIKLKDRLRIESVSMFAVALLACQQRGGNLTKAMDNISTSLEQLQRLELKRDSNTAGGRLMVITLALFPFCFGGIFFLIDPTSTSLVFGTVEGQIVLCAVIVLTYVAMRWAFWLISAVD